MQVSTILDSIDLGSIALPEFQRGYVWNRDQVRGLMVSLYRRHPVGGLLVWVTRTDNATVRGDGPRALGTVQLLLDGQQRITSLYGIVRGKSPQFFEGNSQAFTGLCFNLDTEEFKFYSPLEMRDNPLWIGVTEAMQTGGTHAVFQRLLATPALQPNLPIYMERLSTLEVIVSVPLLAWQHLGHGC